MSEGGFDRPRSGGRNWTVFDIFTYNLSQQAVSPFIVFPANIERVSVNLIGVLASLQLLRPPFGDKLPQS